MENLLNDYKAACLFCFTFLSNQFRNSKLTTGDYEDCVSTAWEKLLLDAKKTEPTLTASRETLRYLSKLAAIDLLRRRKYEVLIDTYPLSICEQLGHSISKQDIRKAVDSLPQMQQDLIQERYGIFGQKAFETMALETINVRDREKTRGYKVVAPKLGITTVNARVTFNRDIKPCLVEVLRHKMVA